MKPVGVFIVGALGDIATMVAVGAAALTRGLAGSTGLVTELGVFEGAGLAPLSALRLGGVDIRQEGGGLDARARSLASHEVSILRPELVEAVEPDLREISSRIGGGFLSAAAPADYAALGKGRFDPQPRQGLAWARDLLKSFRRVVETDTIVVVNLASTEPRDQGVEELEDEGALERRLDESDRPVPASLLYAMAAQDEGCGYVNFTPSCGASSRAMSERAERLGVVHAGRDGKTGETLLKSALAPVFQARHLRVLSWAGFNILGNRDGLTLSDPGSKATKLSSKSGTLRPILGEGNLGTEHIGIDYVPSLGAWKVAWDHVHFEGFLGARMALELTWRGCDSALAAPLVLDLVRLVERAMRAGRRGAIVELASFFKDPVGTVERAFPEQLDMLWRLASALRKDEARAAALRQA